MCVLFVIPVCVYVFPPYVFSEFNSAIEGSFCALILFLCSILCLMCSGSSLHVECILPFRRLGLSAYRIMFVKMVFAMCISGGG